MKHTTALFLYAMLFVGCKTLQPTIEQQSHDSIVIRTEHKIDSIWQDRWHTQYIKGDTVYKWDSIYVDRFKWITKTDTVRMTDTIPVIREVPVVTNQVPTFYRNCTIALWLIVLIAVVYIAYRIIKAIYIRK